MWVFGRIAASLLAGLISFASTAIGEESANSPVSADELVRQGLAAFDAGVAGAGESGRASFVRAAGLLDEAIRRMDSPPAGLYLNFAHAALQAGHRGDAVWGYRQVLAIEPRNVTARDNLMSLRAELPSGLRRFESAASIADIARAEAVDWFPRVTPWIALLGAGCLAVGIRWRRGWAYQWGVALLCLGLGMEIAVRSNWLLPAAEGVLTVDRTTLRTADSPRAAASIATPLPEGTEVKLFRFRDSWWQVELPLGQRGWVPAANLRVIQGH